MLNFKISDSGIPVYHVRVPNSAVCKVMIVANCGSAQEERDSWGVAHFLEHMAFQGTPTKNKHQVSREQAMVGNYNAYTNCFNTAYHFDSLNEDFERGLQLLKEAVFDSNYPEQEFEKEKNVIVEEWRMYDNYPTEHFWDFLAAKCFGEDEGHSIIGTEESIRSMNPEKLNRYRDKWYGKENLFIVVVGNVDFDRAMNAVNNTLPSIKSVEKTRICLKELQCKESKYVLETDRFEQACFGLVQKWVSNQEILERNYVPNFFVYAFNKLLYEYIRDDLGLCYGVSVSNLNHQENNYSIISMLTNNDYLEKAEAELRNLFFKVKSDGFPLELFEICKKQYLYSRVKCLDNAFGITTMIVNGVTASSNPNWFIDKGNQIMDMNALKKCAENLKPKDLQDFAQSHLIEGVQFTMISKK